MISIEEQQKLLLAIARKLKKSLTMYAIGGTAMMFHGFKETTLDIDLVFENEKDRETFKQAIKEIGYKEIDAIKIYRTKINQPEMFSLGDERFDLFVRNIIDFIFSKEMQERADQTHQFDKNLMLKIANYHDIILMKCATDRLKDIDDARKIITTKKIEWNILIEEAKNQIRLGKTRTAFELGEFLERLKYKMKLDIPKETLDELFKIVEKQAEDKQKH